MIKKTSKNQVRRRKHARIRKHVSGTSERPRLNVYRSNKHIYAQLIDDVSHQTLAAVSSLDKELGDVNGGNIEGAKAIGRRIAEVAKDKGIEDVVFDRSGYIYHGRVAALAEGAREAGLKF